MSETNTIDLATLATIESAYREAARWADDRDVGDAEWFDVWHNLPTASELVLAAATDSPSQFGHELYLTRQRHGVGFWAYPEKWGVDGSIALTDFARKLGEV